LKFQVNQFSNKVQS